MARTSASVLRPRRAARTRKARWTSSDRLRTVSIAIVDNPSCLRCMRYISMKAIRQTPTRKRSGLPNDSRRCLPVPLPTPIFGWLFLLGRGDGLGEPACPVLALVEHDGQRLLQRAAASFGPGWPDARRGLPRHGGRRVRAAKAVDAGAQRSVMTGKVLPVITDRLFSRPPPTGVPRPVDRSQPRRQISFTEGIQPIGVHLVPALGLSKESGPPHTAIPAGPLSPLTHTRKCCNVGPTLDYKERTRVARTRCAASRRKQCTGRHACHWMWAMKSKAI